MHLTFIVCSLKVFLTYQTVRIALDGRPVPFLTLHIIKTKKKYKNREIGTGKGIRTQNGRSF